MDSFVLRALHLCETRSELANCASICQSVVDVLVSASLALAVSILSLFSFHQSSKGAAREDIGSKFAFELGCRPCLL